jgi:hypothetical protein
MKIILNNTSKIVTINGGIKARIWEGETESGIKCHAYITRICIADNEPRREEFDRELKEQSKPSRAIADIPMMIIVS